MCRIYFFMITTIIIILEITFQKTSYKVLYKDIKTGKILRNDKQQYKPRNNKTRNTKHIKKQ